VKFLLTQFHLLLKIESVPSIKAAFPGLLPRQPGSQRKDLTALSLRALPSPIVEIRPPKPAVSDDFNILLQKSSFTLRKPRRAPERSIQRLEALFRKDDEVGGALRVLVKAATHSPLDSNDDLYLLLIASEAYRRSRERKP
jgi:hypothetical protein